MLATASSQQQQTQFGLTEQDRSWLADSTQTKIAKALKKGHSALKGWDVAKKEIIELNAQIGRQGEKISKMILKEEQLGEQKKQLQAEIVICDDQIVLRDKEIGKLKVRQWLVIGVAGIVVAGTIVIATQVQ